MAITIDWSTRVIFVPKDFLTIVTAPDLFSMDLNAFRLALKDIEDNTDGIVNPDTHKHNTTVELDGVTYARILEVINGYTVTFEDGQYAIDLVGANSNVSAVTNVNQVSIRSANAAGLVEVCDGTGGNSGVLIPYSALNLEIEQHELTTTVFTSVLELDLNTNSLELDFNTLTTAVEVQTKDLEAQRNEQIGVGNGSY